MSFLGKKVVRREKSILDVNMINLEETLKENNFKIEGRVTYPFLGNPEPCLVVETKNAKATYTRKKAVIVFNTDNSDIKDKQLLEITKDKYVWDAYEKNLLRAAPVAAGIAVFTPLILDYIGYI